MKFRCTPAHPSLKVHGVGQFVDGILEVDDEHAINRLRAVDPVYGIEAIADHDGPFDPTAHNVDDVRDYLRLADAEEAKRVLEVERARIDRDPRVGVLALEQAPSPTGVGEVPADAGEATPGA